jgi:hypothetical protein
MWLHVPNLPARSSASAQASEGSSSASPMPFRAWEGAYAAWALSSGKPILRPSSWRGWVTRPWIRLLSPTISRPLMADRGAIAWILSLPAILASRSPSQASSEASPTSDGSGTTSGASFAKWDHATSSWRTCEVISGKASTPSSARLLRAGGLRNGTLSARPPSVHLTSESVSSASLPTPSAVPYGSNKGGKAGRVGKDRFSLMLLARKGLLPTTTTADCKGSGALGYTKGHTGTTLTDIAVRGMLPTPTASETVGGIRVDDGKRGSKLSDLIRGGMKNGMLPTSTARDCKGRLYRDDALPNVVGDGIGGMRLSPHFVEWMMNFPIRWTEIGLIESTPSATPSSPPPRSAPSSRSGTGSTIRTMEGGGR